MGNQALSSTVIMKGYGMTWHCHDPYMNSLEFGGKDMTYEEVQAAHALLNALGTGEFEVALKRFGEIGRKRSPIYQTTLSYQQFHELAGTTYTSGLVTRTFVALMRYATINPERLLLICPECGENFADGCGHVSTSRWNNVSFPVFERQSLIALAEHFRNEGFSSVWQFGNRSLETLEFVLQRS